MKVAQVTAKSYNHYRNSYHTMSKPKSEELPVSREILTQPTPTFMNERAKPNHNSIEEEMKGNSSSLIRLLSNEIESLNSFIVFIMNQLKEKDEKLLKTERQYTELKYEYNYLIEEINVIIIKHHRLILMQRDIKTYLHNIIEHKLYLRISYIMIKKP